MAYIHDSTDLFDLEEKHTRLSSIGVNSFLNVKECISTKLLAIDLVTGGGYSRGREYELTGPEHSGKTNLIYCAISSALSHIPGQLKGLFFDIEGVVDPVWFSNISGHKVSDVFGLKDKNGNWTVKPQIRYYKPAFGEQALKLLRRALKNLPDKVLVGETWYYMWSPKEPKAAKKTGGQTVSDLRSMLKGEYDKKLYSKFGNFYIPIPGNYSGPELLICVDSWAAMTPESVAEDDSNAMGSQARMFGKYLNDVKSLIAAKGCTVVGTNQIREKPGGYGNPEYNPGGNTKKHSTDCRVRVQAVKNPAGQKGMLEEEGSDEYRFFKVKNLKNKAAQPFKECTGRWWISHEGSTGFGPDPVHDTLEYLRMTGQITRVRGAKKGGVQINFNVKNPSKATTKLAKEIFTLPDFKKAILSPGDIGFDIRGACFKQLRSGRGIKLFYKNEALASKEED